ncbi:MAG: substrate-binding domain-containing protein, partial [Candidatus Omnitrophica bacterium]|nr:substrate-binding domain-containing protein [Candidatus Omnitrophota bacterium]
SVALPGAAEALQKNNAADRVFLTGLSTPNSMREYIEDGTVKKMVLWNPVDLGYLTIYAAKMLAEGNLNEGTIEAGRLGEVEVKGSEVLLGEPLVFDKDNIDQFDF